MGHSFHGIFSHFETHLSVIVEAVIFLYHLSVGGDNKTIKEARHVSLIITIGQKRRQSTQLKLSRNYELTNYLLGEARIV